MKEMWDKRYSNSEYVYGEEPNVFFKTTLDSLPAGRILLPAEGEGRNAVYAAKNGWQVEAFDQSVEAKNKATLLAKKNEVDFQYHVFELNELEAKYELFSFDAIALIYLHLPMNEKQKYIQQLLLLLKVGGTLIFEAFSKDQLKYQKENAQAGGPQNLEMLYSEDEIKSIFEELNIAHLSTQEVALQEGQGHSGKASVIRFVGKKIK